MTDDSSPHNYYRPSRVYHSLHGTVNFLGIPRVAAALLVMVILFDVLAAHTFYSAGVALVLWVILIVVYRHDPVFCQAMVKKAYRRIYK